MSEETGMVLRNSNSDLQLVAKLFAESGYFPDAKSMAQAFVKVKAGQEMGIPAMAAMTGIAIIQGEPVAGANIIAAKVKMAGYDYRVRKLDNHGCTIEFFKNGESLGISDFSEQDAKEAGLLGKDNWRKWARNMYFARAISNGQRWYCPDATLGMVVYTPDELGGQVDEDGNPVVTDAPRKTESLSSIIDKKNATDAEVVDESTGEVSEPPDMPEPPEEEPLLSEAGQHFLALSRKIARERPEQFKTTEDVIKYCSIFGEPGNETWIRDISKASEKWIGKSYGKCKALGLDVGVDIHVEDHKLPL